MSDEHYFTAVLTGAARVGAGEQISVLAFGDDPPVMLRRESPDPDSTMVEVYELVGTANWHEKVAEYRLVAIQPPEDEN